MKNLIVLIFSTVISISSFAQEVYPDENYNQLIRDTEGGWIAADATYSIALPDGRTLWLFGDTFIGAVNADNSIVEGAQMVRNCGVVQDGDSWTSLYNGTFENPEDLFQSAEDTTWYWPDHGIVENDTLLIYMAKYYTDPEGPPGWNFVFAGVDIARLRYPELEVIDVVNLEYTNLNHVKYGDMLFVDGDYTYVYGRKEEDVSGYIIPFPHVARYPAGNWTSNWEFYDGTGWSTNPEDSQQINDYQVSQQYGVFKYFDKYVLISQDIWLSTEIYSITSDTPYGPWENQTVLYDTPILFDGTFTYNAWPHVQHMQDHELLISYNSNGDFWEIFDNVEIYRPRFIRVPMEMIDPYFENIDVEKHSQTNSLNVSVYPNPSQGNPVIDVKSTSEADINIRVCTMNGRVIFEDTYNHFDNIRLPAGLLSRAMYSVQIQQGEQVCFEKISVM